MSPKEVSTPVYLVWDQAGGEPDLPADHPHGLGRVRARYSSLAEARAQADADIARGGQVMEIHDATNPEKVLWRPGAAE